jgi:hypothetical protein
MRRPRSVGLSKRSPAAPSSDRITDPAPSNVPSSVKTWAKIRLSEPYLRRAKREGRTQESKPEWAATQGHRALRAILQMDDQLLGLAPNLLRNDAYAVVLGYFDCTVLA